jgi:polysaccharide export outer membrane protein
MKRALVLLWLLSNSVVVWGQSPSPRPPAATAPAAVSPKSTIDTTATRRSDYVIGPGDVVDITVFNHQDLSGKFAVGSDGSISYPLVGSIRLAGHSLQAAEAAVRDALAAGFLRQPQLTLTVSEFGSRRVYLIGEVRSPGAIPLTSGLTLLEALAMAGSVTESAGVEVSVISPKAGARVDGPLMPGQPGAARTVTLSLSDLQRGLSTSNVTLEDGDTVFVPKGGEIYVLGQVRTPGPQPFRQNLTVLQAISIAGGLTDLGASSRVRIIRIDGDEKKEIRGKPTDKVLPGDTILVPTRWF